MKRILILTALCALLCGCANAAPIPEHPVPAPTLTTSSSLEPGSPLRWEGHGDVRIFPISGSSIQGILSWGENLLLFSGEEQTTLTVISGRDYTVLGSLELSFLLSPEDPSLAFHAESLSFFDSGAAQTLVLDAACRCIQRIPKAEAQCTSQVLSRDRQTLYYSTPEAIQAWELSTGIRRTVKELSGAGWTAAGTCWQDSVLLCRTDTPPGAALLDAHTGRQLAGVPEDFTLTQEGDTFFASFTLGQVQSLVYGTSVEAAQALLPEDYSGRSFFLPASRRCLCVSSAGEGTCTLTLYDLESGGKGESLSLTSSCPIAAAEAPEGVWLLLNRDADSGSTLCLWSPESDSFSGCYREAYRPGETAMAQCRTMADSIGRKHGIRILIGDEAAAQEPWDYALQPEHRALLLCRELEALDRWLSNYPEPILRDTAAHFEGFTICLVQSLTGRGTGGSLNAAAGVQFFRENHAYLALAVGKYAERTLYHELLHAMSTHLLTHSSALDRWEALNPSSFSYDYSYETNAVRDSGIYLRRGQEYFVDTYSMSFPKEDQARVMEYAMLPGNADLFASPHLQQKLRALCLAIRESYGLEDDPRVFLWEQYLN